VAERAQAAPGQDLFGMLVREHGDDLGERDLIGIGVTVLQAGHETTAAMITSAVFMLLTEPGQLELLRDEPRLIRNAIEELLRYLAVVQISPPRRATRDTVVGGQPIAAGELLLVSLPAANHDPGLVDDPGRLDITRSASRHLAFGHGIHHCLGAPLARMELEIAIPALLRRLPGLALAIDPAEAEYTSGTVVHGLKTLPVTW
jgi:cytochrome P450